MFTEPTVFILGAGASWHYGYPTGEELVKKVLEKAELLSNFLENSVHTVNLQWPKFVEPAKTNVVDEVRRNWQVVLDKCKALKAGLEQVRPLVIDYYLGWNASFKDLGRLLIAWVILDCERRCMEAGGGNINRRGQNPVANLKLFNDDWCRFLLHKLAINCKTSSDLFKNQVKFVTFNYDLSLEIALSNGLAHIQLLKPQVIEFLAEDRIFHIYGKVRNGIVPSTLAWSDEAKNPKALDGPALLNYQRGYKDFLDALYEASLSIRVIGPEDKGSDEAVIQKAREAIERATYVYILGYGFDENNSKRLGFQQSLSHNGLKKFVHFTNFGENNRVNKRASQIFFGRMDQFPSGGQLVFPRETPYYYERSFRNVYDALERDFESLEAEPEKK
jgi:hypothetical protein